MRLREFAQDSANPDSNLITALSLIRNRYKDSDAMPRISTQSLINMVINTDRTFDYAALVNANKNNPAVQNLIKTFNKDYVELRSDDEESSDDTTTTNTPSGDPTQNPVDTVDDMAKRAAKTRGAPIF
jgi:hypothetical protein